MHKQGEMSVQVVITSFEFLNIGESRIGEWMQEDFPKATAGGDHPKQSGDFRITHSEDVSYNAI